VSSTKCYHRLLLVIRVMTQLMQWLIKLMKHTVTCSLMMDHSHLYCIGKHTFHVDCGFAVICFCDTSVSGTGCGRISVLMPVVFLYFWISSIYRKSTNRYIVLLSGTQCLSATSPSRRFGAVGSDVDQINEVTVRRARLVLGWVTVSGFNSRCEKFISV